MRVNVMIMNVNVIELIVMKMIKIKKGREGGREGEVRLNRTGVFKLFIIFIRF